MQPLGESINDLVKPNLGAEYELEKHSWFPRDNNDEVRAYDKRKPRLFKTEFEGEGIIGLSSKMYVCYSDSNKNKFSCKGVNRGRNDINKDTYLRVLRTKEPGYATNRATGVYKCAAIKYVLTLK
jgi:hypothetical protein